MTSLAPWVRVVSAVRRSLREDDDLRRCDTCYRGSLSKCIDTIEHAISVEQGISSAPAPSEAHVRDVRLQAEELIEVCNAKFAVFPYNQVPRSWRRLYTDAAIVKACSVHIGTGQHEQFHEKSLDPKALLDAIKALDLAIIVAGAPGVDRKELIQNLISSLQSKLLGASDDLRPVKRRRLSASTHTQLGEAIKDKAEELPCRARATIPILDTVPTFEDIISNQMLHKPFIVRDFAKDWPALQPDVDDPTRAGQHAWWADGDYLRKLAGPGRVVPVEIGGKYTEAGWSQDIISWDDFLESSGWPGKHQNGSSGDAKQAPRWHGKPLYLAQHTLLEQVPGLYKDMLLPDLVYSSPSAPPWLPDYRPPIDSETGDPDVLVNVWIGPPSTESPAHTDPYYNCYVQVVGRKQVWLAPPGSNDNGAMQPFGDGASREEDSDDGSSDDDDDDDDGAAKLMTNTSQVDVFDMDRKPPERFVKDVLPHAMKAVLEPGDLLFFPPRWWHAMQSLTRSFSVSMWF